MNINPGEFNRKIKIIQHMEGYVMHEPWASVRNESGKEIVKNEGEFSESLTRFFIRYTKKGLDTGMIIEFKGQFYDIEYINNLGFRNEYIEILAKTRSFNRYA